jgi:hypothetical protein
MPRCECKAMRIGTLAQLECRGICFLLSLADRFPEEISWSVPYSKYPLFWQVKKVIKLLRG